MKKFFLVAVCAVFASFASAQVSWNAKAGLNFSSITNAKADLKVGYHLGVGAEFPLTQSLYLQPSLLLTAKGATGSDDGADVTMNPIYLEVPVMLAYKIPVSDKSNFVLSAGPYFAYGIAGKATVEDSGVEVKVDCFGSGENKVGLKRFDLGLGIGGAMEFEKFLIGLNVSYGLLDVSPKWADESAQNVNIGLSVGYRF